MNTVRYIILTLFTCISFCYAQPANDNCANAISLCPQTPLSSNNLNGTIDNGIAGLCFASTNGVWYKFKAASNGDVSIRLGNILAQNANNELQMAIMSFTTECNLSTATILGCNNGNTSSSFSVSASGLTIGKTYFVYVDGGETLSPPNGEFNFDISDSGTAVAPFAILNKVNATCNRKNGSFAFKNIRFNNRPHTFSLNGGAAQTDSSFKNLGKGTYSVVITDANGCTFIQNFTITDNGFSSIQSTTTNADCSNNSNGSILLNVLPISNNYTYSLDGGTPQSSNNFPNVIAGTHFITISGNGCDTTAMVIVSSTNVITSAIGQGSIINCGATNGTVTYTSPVQPPAPAGTQYIYRNLNTNISNSTGIFQGLVAGTYTIEISNSANPNCKYTDIVTVQSLPGPSIDTTKNSADECESKSGAMTILAKGGVKPYTYSIDGINYGSENQYSNLTSGTYTVYVKDALGCIGTYQSKIVKKVPGISLNCDAGENQVIIEGDKATVQIQAALPSSVTWSPTTFSTTVDDNKFVLFPSSTTNYSMNVTYPNGCICTDDVTIEVRKKMDIPNTFTPNGDKLNDRFTIKYLESYRDIEITILDRWGTTVYHTTNYTDETAWDGTCAGSKVPVATYYYIIRFKYNETKKDDNSYYYQGSINLIR